MSDEDEFEKDYENDIKNFCEIEQVLFLQLFLINNFFMINYLSFN
jgi:hypothetical protein